MQTQSTRVDRDAVARTLIISLVEAYLHGDEQAVRTLLDGLEPDELSQVHTLCHHLGQKALYRLTEGVHTSVPES